MGKNARLKRLRKEIRQGEENTPPASNHRFDKKLETITVGVLFFIIFAAGVFLRIDNLKVSHRSPDEGVLTYQGITIAENGSNGVRYLISEYNANSKLWLYPKPVRLGYLWILAEFIRTTGIKDVIAGSYLSLFCSVISLLLLMALGLRFFNRWIALIALLLFAVSPLELAIARRTWQDAMVGCLGLLLFYLACEIIHRRNKTIWSLFFVMIGSYYMLIKESCIAIYGLYIAWILWHMLVNEKTFLRASLFILFSITGAALSGIALINSAGSLTSVIEVMRHFTEALPTNQYAVEYQTGPWYTLIQGFWILSPVSLVMCVIGFIGVFLKKDYFGNKAIFGIFFFIVSLMIITVATPYSLNLRYLSALYGPFYLIAALGFWQIIIYSKSVLRDSIFSVAVFIVALAVALTAVYDYNNFKKYFVKTGIVDTTVRFIREISRAYKI